MKNIDKIRYKKNNKVDYSLCIYNLLEGRISGSPD